MTVNFYGRPVVWNPERTSIIGEYDEELLKKKLPLTDYLKYIEFCNGKIEKLDNGILNRIFKANPFLRTPTELMGTAFYLDGDTGIMKSKVFDEHNERYIEGTVMKFSKSYITSATIGETVRVVNTYTKTHYDIDNKTHLSPDSVIFSPEGA